MSILVTLLAQCSSLDMPVYSAEECSDLAEKHRDNLNRILREAVENLKKANQGKPKKR